MNQKAQTKYRGNTDQFNNLCLKLNILNNNENSSLTHYPDFNYKKNTLNGMYQQVTSSNINQFIKAANLDM